MKYKGRKVKIVRDFYTKTGTRKLSLVTKEGKKVTTITYGGGGEASIKSDEVLVKDTGRNAGMLDWLIRNEVVWEPHDFFTHKGVDIPICKIRRVRW